VKYRSLTRATQPVVEPVSVSDAKVHLRVDGDEDNLYVASLIAAARDWIESYLDRTLVKTQWTLKLDRFPIGDIELPRPPMLPLAVSLTFTSESGAVSVLASNLYRVDSASTPGVVRPLREADWPAYMDDQNAITITFWAGYGEDGRSVPAPIRHAILMLVGQWYERRAAADSMGGNEIPFGVSSLLSSQKWGSYR
jgi:uncharacterized phiE125 gp8 family phage protein